ncbi:hypothetical protein HB763_17775 [Vibrio campbellii]|uniref:hypothetical protein n=1 Tax=Vibrio campbellii TaxID=680 RepID=UPI002108974A|nr:hypothetical protein [Vibrio campbellii]UTZ38491.1 hypothetical protein HB763_17775 [Vibrio campbellii]
MLHSIGDSSTPSPPPKQITVPEGDTNESEEPVEKEETTVPIEDVTMQDLEVPDNISYKSLNESSLNADINGFSSQRAYLSVYKECVEHSSGGYVAKYPSKVASVPLDKGTANINFNVSDSQGRLVVEIWFYDGSAPIQRVITSGDSSWVM